MISEIKIKFGGNNMGIRTKLDKMYGVTDEKVKILNLIEEEQVRLSIILNDIDILEEQDKTEYRQNINKTYDILEEIRNLILIEGDDMDLIKFAKLMELTTSPDENEALNSLRIANAMLLKNDLTWSDFIGQKTFIINEIEMKKTK